jgi:AraC-like DNA-binding protein
VNHTPSNFFAKLGHEHGLQLFDALPDTRFFIKDARGVYMKASLGMCLAHGFSSPDGVVGKTDHDFIPAYLADHYTRDDQDVLGGEEIWNRMEMVMRNPGCTDWYVTSKVPLRAKTGEIIGLAGISRDLAQAAKFATPFARLAPALGHIREHYAESIPMHRLSEICGMSERSFQRHFKQSFRVGPAVYVRQFRLGKACQLLIETDKTITVIAQETGFSDHSHLVREFTRLLAESPGKYRRRYAHK